jgi:hypothetical protein
MLLHFMKTHSWSNRARPNLRLSSRSSRPAIGGALKVVGTLGTSSALRCQTSASTTRQAKNLLRVSSWKNLLQVSFYPRSLNVHACDESIWTNASFFKLNKLSWLLTETFLTRFYPSIVLIQNTAKVKRRWPVKRNSKIARFV